MNLRVVVDKREVLPLLWRVASLHRVNLLANVRAQPPARGLVDRRTLLLAGRFGARSWALVRGMRPERSFSKTRRSKQAFPRGATQDWMRKRGIYTKLRMNS